MATLVLVGFVVGALLGLRFRVFILVPATTAACLAASITGAALGHSVGEIAGAAVLSLVALQAGYIAQVMRSIARGDRDARGRPTFASVCCK